MNNENIKQLIHHAEDSLSNLIKKYEYSLENQSIDPLLLIDTKNILENLRSCLDYIARDIVIEVLNSSLDTKTYFPIVAPDKNIESYRGAINRNLPKLESINKELFNLLESFQPYHSEYIWLSNFATITSELKHTTLIPQKRNERIMISSQNSLTGGRVTWNPSAVKFGNGVYINGAFVNPINQLPINSPSNVITKEIWVDFLFENTDISALNLLKQSLSGIKVISEKIYKIITANQ